MHLNSTQADRVRATSPVLKLFSLGFVNCKLLESRNYQSGVEVSPSQPVPCLRSLGLEMRISLFDRFGVICTKNRSGL